MPKRVTYGVNGLIDWCAIINVGKARLNVHFTGGAITKYGTTPAEFTTADPTTQRIIEDSAYYRSGRIRTLRSVGVQDIKPMSRKYTAEATEAYQSSELPIDDTVPATTDAAEPTVIEVSCLQDAIDHMHIHHGIPSVRIRTLESLQDIAAQYGITFKIN